MATLPLRNGFSVETFAVSESICRPFPGFSRIFLFWEEGGVRAVLKIAVFRMFMSDVLSNEVLLFHVC